MAITATLQGVLDWSRLSIPDPKTRLKSVREEEIGRTTAATPNRETFYLKHSPVASVFLYIEPYTFTASSTLSGETANAKVFLWATSTLSCTFSNGSSDPPLKPNQYKPVLADYEYNQRLPYAYTDSDLESFVLPAVSYLNNTYGFSYTSTGTVGTNLDISPKTDDDKEILSKGVAILVRRNFAEQQQKVGWGVRFRGPMQSIDSVAQMKEYNEVTKFLENHIKEKAAKLRVSDAAAKIDIYVETVVTD